MSNNFILPPPFPSSNDVAGQSNLKHFIARAHSKQRARWAKFRFNLHKACNRRFYAQFFDTLEYDDDVK